MSGAVAVSREWISSAALEGSASACPQLAQNFASGATLASQRGQMRGGDSTVIERPSYLSPLDRPRALPGSRAPPAGRGAGGRYGSVLVLTTVTDLRWIRISAQAVLFASFASRNSPPVVSGGSAETSTL